MRKIVCRSGLTLKISALALAAAATIAGCKEEIAPFNPRAMQGKARASSATGNIPVVERPLPTTLQSPFESTTEPTTGPDGQPTSKPHVPPATGPAIGVGDDVVRMSLREMIQRAVANSSDVKVAAYQPAIDETRVTEAEARFDPTFFTNFQYSVDRVLAPTPENVAVDPNNTETVFRTYDLQAGVRQELESGGKVELKYEPRYTRRSPDFAPGTNSINPFWTSDLTFQITQPLLRDFGADVNRARIVINRNNQKISLLDFRQKLEEVIGGPTRGGGGSPGIEETYWNLMAAEREVHIFEELLSRTLKTGEILYNRRTQDVGRVQMSQANSSIEQRRTALITARAKVRKLSTDLKALMNDPDFPVAGNVLILPADKPLEDQIHFNLEDQINTAMENRLELGQQQLRAETAAVAADVAKNNLLPQLNFVGSIGTTGLGGAWGTAIQDADLDHLEYTAGVQLEIPIGNRAARAIWKRAQLQRLQAIEQYRFFVDRVSADVKDALIDVGAAYEQIAGARQARFAAEDALSAVEEREQANEMLTPEFVNRKLDLQAQLASQQQAEVEALSNYQVALSKLELAKGTLLRYNNVIMEEAPLGTQITATMR